MPLIPNSPAINGIDYRILIDNKSINRDINITSLRIVKELGLTSYAEVTIQLDSLNPPSNNAFDLGINKKIEIKIEYYSIETIFTGKIISQQISQSSTNSPYYLTILCKNNNTSYPSNLTNSPVLSVQYHRDVLGFEISMNKKNEIEGSIRIMGIHGSILGNLIQLNGFPEGFNKSVKIIGIVHLLDVSGWQMKVNLR